MNHLELSNIAVGYDDVVLSDLSLEIKHGECVGIIGPNGAGKSTLLKAVTKLLPLKKGKIIIEGEDASSFDSKQLARKVAVVNQSSNVSFNYLVSDIVKLGRFAHSDQSLESVEPYMKYTDIWNLRSRGFQELSGGEKQRVIISQALAQEAKLVMMDEPTSDLDIRHQVDVFNVLGLLQQKQQITVIAIMHDLNLAALFCNRIIALKKGKVVADGTPEEVLTPANLKDIYGINVIVEKRQDNNRPFVMLRKSTD